MVAGLGGLLQLKSKSDFDKYDDEVTARCDALCADPDPQTATCPLSESQLGVTKKRAVLENRLAIGFMAVGGVTVAAGIAAFILNQPTGVKSETPPGTMPALRVHATVLPGQVGVVFNQGF